MNENLYVGIDVGSTTIKIVVLDKEKNNIYSNYQRHFSDTKKTLFDIFETELGRTLSPIEYEIINGWLTTCSEEIIILALKEATFNGVSNFRYIDRIINEWNKKGIKTKEDVEKNRQEFKNKKDNKKQELFDYDWLNDNENN